MLICEVRDISISADISFQIVDLSIRLIVMWSVPFNLNLYDTHMGLAMIYNQGPFSSSSYWFNKMYYSDIGPHVRGMGGKVILSSFTSTIWLSK